MVENLITNAEKRERYKWIFRSPAGDSRLIGTPWEVPYMQTCVQILLKNDIHETLINNFYLNIAISYNEYAKAQAKTKGDEKNELAQ